MDTQKVSAEYRDDRFPGHMLESFEVVFAPARWRDETAGYAGTANWRDEYGMGSRSLCGHAHSTEDAALKCIRKRHEVRQ